MQPSCFEPWRTHRFTIGLAAALTLCCGPAHALPPGVRAVNHQAPPGGNGQSWATAYNDLQNALAEVNGNPSGVEQIWVAAGTYKPALPVAPAAQAATFELHSGLALYGGFASGETLLEQRDFAANITILSGHLAPQLHTWHVVTANAVAATTILDGFVVTGGEATEASPFGPVGAGIRIAGGSPLIRNCTIIGNAVEMDGPPPWDAAMGGGVLSTPSATFVNCIFEDNWSIGSGGAVAGGGSFTDCVFLNNRSLYEGGAFIGEGTFINCHFEKNRTSTFGKGGGVAWGDSSFIECDFIDNWAIFDAGAVGGDATFIDCAFFDNRADTGAFGYGTFEFIDCHLENNFGLYTSFYQANIRAVNSTFIANDPLRECNLDATNCTFTGAEYILHLFDQSGDLRLVNTSIWGNKVPGIVHFMIPSKLEIINSTIVNNTKEWLPPRPALELNISTGRIHNSILWNNNGNTQHDQIELLAGTLDVQHTYIQGWTGTLGGTGNYGFNPVFADLQGRLAEGSPAIDAGNNTLLPTGITLDLDGNPRFHNDPGTPNNGTGTSPFIDIGAFEFQGTTCYANCDRSTTPPILNIDDFTCFVNLYAQGNPLANCDGSTTPPILNIDDFTCFVNKFAAGCP